MIKAKPKKKIHIQTISYDLPTSTGGCCLISDILPEQIFNVSKNGKYYFLTKKHFGFKIRLTERAFIDNFDIVGD